MFGKLFGRGEDGPGADPHALPVPRRKSGVHPLRALGDRRVLALVEAADAGDWEGVKEALAPFDLGRDHQVLGQLTDIGGLEDWIVRAVEEDKEHRAEALLISGARHIHWGWEARTAARAVDVSQEQWRVFHERLHIAERQLLEAAELRPDWITPWRQLLTSARGMSLGSPVAETRRDAALRRDPFDLEVHLSGSPSSSPAGAVSRARRWSSPARRSPPRPTATGSAAWSPWRTSRSGWSPTTARASRTPHPDRAEAGRGAQHPAPRLRAPPGLAGRLQHLRDGPVPGREQHRLQRLPRAGGRVHRVAVDVHVRAAEGVRALRRKTF